MILDEKYVLHIPLYKYENKELIRIDIDDVLDDLISKLSENGYENLYITDALGYYKSRSYDEKLLTIFTSSSCDNTLPDEIFRQWFNANNDILCQEAIAYEHKSKLFVENL